MTPTKGQKEQSLTQIVDDLRTVQRETFGAQAGECPDPFRDYDRACELAGMMRRSIEALENRIKGCMQGTIANSAADGHVLLRILNAVLYGQEVTSNNETGATEMKKYSLENLPSDDVICFRLNNVAVKLADARNAVQAFSNPHTDSGLRDVEIDPVLIDKISLGLGDICTDLAWVREEAARRNQENGPGTDTPATIRAALLWFENHAGRKNAVEVLRRHGRVRKVADLKRENYPTVRAAIEGWADAKGLTVGEYAAASDMTDTNETL